MAELASLNRIDAAVIREYRDEKRSDFARFLNEIALVPHLAVPAYLSDELFAKFGTFSSYLNEAFKLGLPVQMRTKSGDGLLNYFCRQHSSSDAYEVIETLLKNGVEPNQTNHSGQNALASLAMNTELRTIDRAPDMIRLLLRFNVDIHHVDYCGYNAIMRLSEQQNVEAFYKYSKILLECGIGHSGALYNFLVCHKSIRADIIPDLIKLFHFYHLDVKKVDGHGTNLLHLLVKKCNFSRATFRSVIELFISYGVDINHRDKEKHNILNLMLRESKIYKFKTYYKMIEALVKRGFDVGNIDGANNNALILFLHHATKYSNEALDVVSILVDGGIDINHTYRCKLNVLWIVMQRKDIELGQVLKITRHLIALGASVNSGRDPCQPFCDSPLLLIMNFRLLRGTKDDDEELCDVDVAPEDSRPKQAKRDDRNWYDIIKLLLQHGDNPNAYVRNGPRVDNLLLILCRSYKGNNLCDLIRMMTFYGMDVNDAAKRSNCPDLASDPLFWIKKNDHQKGRYNELLQVLVECGLKIVDWDKDMNKERVLKSLGKKTIKFLCDRNLGLQHVFIRK